MIKNISVSLSMTKVDEEEKGGGMQSCLFVIFAQQNKVTVMTDIATR